MTFVPAPDKIEVIPLKREGILERMENDFLEVGQVVAIGSDIPSNSVTVGDTVFFLAHGCWETAEVEGVKHWVIPYTPEYILGRLAPDVGEVAV